MFRRVISQVKPVMARISSRQQQHERLESLGTMAAGLAHELNNPAAAASRTASDLADALAELSKAVGVFIESPFAPENARHLVELQSSALQRCAAQTAVSALAAADLEDELTDQLTGLGLPEAWTLSPPLAAAGIDTAFVQEVSATAGDHAAPALRWIAASLSARQLAGELRDSTNQMSHLVKAIKSYAYMDRGEVVQVDVREGLETTLTILGHKLKHTTIEVTRDYDASLPKLTVHGAELNQVWTNLLDNAIDALGESGHITITTRADGDCAEIDIADDGPGIPDAIRNRVFDPFFTTKDVGRGTGLGLDTARRIIVDRHRGSLALDSRPDGPSSQCGCRSTPRGARDGARRRASQRAHQAPRPDRGDPRLDDRRRRLLGGQRCPPRHQPRPRRRFRRAAMGLELLPADPERVHPARRIADRSPRRAASLHRRRRRLRDRLGAVRAGPVRRPC